MTIGQILHDEITEAKKWLDRETDDSIYKSDLQKRIELINWTLENMKNCNIQICALIETRMNELIDEINKKDSILKADPLDNQVRILDWILYVVCSNE
ncbi:MAG TPA: hypothetical protein VH481_08285 [Nitrososphaeraceae archaeon]|jgi:hypothetical protein